MASKPILYTFGGSVWAAVPELVLAELYPEGVIETKTINLVEGENFHPSFIQKNPNATLPTLESDGTFYTSTTDVTSYLLSNAPTQVQITSDSELIKKIHEDALDPNFALLLAADHETLTTKSTSLPYTFLSNRQRALERISSTPEAAPFKDFYDGKLKDNGGLLALYEGKAPEAAKQAFFAGSKAHLDRLGAFIAEELPQYLSESGFIGGEKPGAEDFHLAAWLTRISATVGATGKGDAVEKLEAAFGNKVHEKVRKYWDAWTERESWAKVYAAGLH